MNFNDLKKEFQKDDAVLKMLHDPDYRSHFFWGDVRPNLEKMTHEAERMEYLEIIANAKGILSIKERNSVLQDIDEAYYGYECLDGHRTGFLSKKEYQLLKDCFSKSQETQFKEGARNQEASELKRLHKEGMSLKGRKAHLVESAGNWYPLKPKGKGDSMVHRALEGEEKKKGSFCVFKKFFGCQKGGDR